MRNLKVFMAYRGTNYHGYQKQDNAVTVQETVENALSVILNEKVSMHGCSRTDTGVHANNYCFSVKTDSKIPTKGFVRGMNGQLPLDISILSCEDVDEDFHARYSCIAKEYIYLIHNSESKDPFSTDLKLHYRRPIDEQRVLKAAKYFIGTHDFAAFCADSTGKLSTVRTIYDLDIEIHGSQVKLLVKGDGFLYNMIRIIVGTLLMVNEKKLPPDVINEILRSKNRLNAGITAQPHGLYLNRVFYK